MTTEPVFSTAALGHLLSVDTIVTWIERTYRRRQAALGRLTPVEYETVMNTPALQSA
ncbi:hypothetical protein ACGFYF_42480 [Streptomyces lavendulae]|uniref:hypothetical protein n=1 Tax=Streptomyces lavendulae TaxID=1914 RepID=UPI00371B8460